MQSIRSEKLSINDKLIKGGNTVNMCTVDLSKAFDKVNHRGLLIKLMRLTSKLSRNN